MKTPHSFLSKQTHRSIPDQLSPPLLLFGPLTPRGTRVSPFRRPAPVRSHTSAAFAAASGSGSQRWRWLEWFQKRSGQLPRGLPLWRHGSRCYDSGISHTPLWPWSQLRGGGSLCQWLVLEGRNTSSHFYSFPPIRRTNYWLRVVHCDQCGSADTSPERWVELFIGFHSINR